MCSGGWVKFPSEKMNTFWKTMVVVVGHIKSTALNRTPKMVKWQRLCGVRFTPVEKPHTQLYLVGGVQGVF